MWPSVTIQIAYTSTWPSDQRTAHTIRILNCTQNSFEILSWHDDDVPLCPCMCFYVCHSRTRGHIRKFSAWHWNSSLIQTHRAENLPIYPFFLSLLIQAWSFNPISDPSINVRFRRSAVVTSRRWWAASSRTARQILAENLEKDQQRDVSK